MREALLAFRTRRVAILAGVVALLLVPIAAAAVLATEGPDGRADEGDQVSYHVTIFDDEGIVYTTDAERAKAAIAKGADLPSNLTIKPYLPQTRVLALTNDPWDTPRFLLGHRVGEVVTTPWMRSPFGDKLERRLPAAFGPMPREFEVDLDLAYARDPPSWLVQHAAREDFAPGALVSYGEGLDARVVAIDGARAQLQLVIPEDPDALVASTVFGFRFKVERLADENVLLRPHLSVGEEFTTAGCRIPDNVIEAGTWRVETLDEDGTIHIVEVPGAARARVLHKTLRIEYEILSIDETTGLGSLLGLLRL